MILVQKILFLKNVPLFSTMPPDTIAWVAEAADETSTLSGQTIFEKGSEGDSMYVIADGSVRIHDGDKTLASLPQGAFFGELSILDGETRSATATAESDCLLLVIRQDSFRRILSKQFDVTENLLKILVRRIREQSTQSQEEQNED
ncbi:MAG TPA: cyclic nucleotide-binding domain-containing protein [Verrucomicrobiota bacterium]|jgi:CRP-like cAMP-binding protein|nr:cyclic nucleotide-binding domain-containing protein [Verrucomicrobiota bacterium]